MTPNISFAEKRFGAHLQMIVAVDDDDDDDDDEEEPWTKCLDE